jgi:hypothetical protein
VLESKFEYEGGRINEVFITSRAGTEVVGRLVQPGIYYLGDDGGWSRSKSSVCRQCRIVRITVVFLKFCVAVEKLFMRCFVCRVSHGLVSWWRDEKHDLPLGMDNRRGGPPSPSIINVITTPFADVVIGALSVMRL